MELYGEGFMDFLSILLNLLVWSISFFVFGLLHEFGHALMYRWSGGDGNWSIIMGWGKPIIQTEKLTINTWFMLPGYCKWAKDHVKKEQAILRCSGGFIINIIFAGLILILLLCLRQSFPVEDFSAMSIDRVLRIMFFSNIYTVAGTIIPIIYPVGNIKGLPSDGLQIYRVIFNRNTTK